MKTVIATTAAPGAIGPYSQAIEAGGFVFVSGQIPLDPATGAFVPGGVEEQAEQSLRNRKAVLAGAGCTLGDVVKTTVFLTDMGAFAAVNAVYAKYFEGDCPAPVSYTHLWGPERASRSFSDSYSASYWTSFLNRLQTSSCL